MKYKVVPAFGFEREGTAFVRETGFVIKETCLLYRGIQLLLAKKALLGCLKCFRCKAEVEELYRLTGRSHYVTVYVVKN